MKSLRKLATAGAMLILATRALAAPAPAFDADLLSLQQAWAHANYEMPAGDARNAAFDTLEERAADLVGRNPARAEALIWQSISIRRGRAAPTRAQMRSTNSNSSGSLVGVTLRRRPSFAGRAKSGLNMNAITMTPITSGAA